MNNPHTWQYVQCVRKRSTRTINNKRQSGIKRELRGKWCCLDCGSLECRSLKAPSVRAYVIYSVLWLCHVPVNWFHLFPNHILYSVSERRRKGRRPCEHALPVLIIISFSISFELSFAEGFRPKPYSLSFGWMSVISSSSSSSIIIIIIRDLRLGSSQRPC
jgi:hypothetical protein